MSDYIYGNSLRAAKSKANYLFEGDFRRRPNQNLSGASRRVARVELIQQAAEQRQNREDTRRREQASLKIQSVWRSYRCRKALATAMRTRFDELAKEILEQRQQEQVSNFSHQLFDQLSKEFIIFYHSGQDEQRFNCLIDLMLGNQEAMVQYKLKNPQQWLRRLCALLKMNLLFLRRNLAAAASTVDRYISFFICYTKSGDMLAKASENQVWDSLIRCHFYSVIRQLAELDVEHKEPSDHQDDKNANNTHDKLFLELLRRSLDTDRGDAQYTDSMSTTAYCFFDQFLQGPLDPIIENYYLPELLKLEPKQLRPKYILAAFHNSLKSITTRLELGAATKNLNQTADYNMEKCKNTIWLCYLFVRALYARVSDFDDLEKVNYINIISVLLEPAEYITNISSIMAANEDADELNAEDDETASNVLNASRKSHHPHQYYPVVHQVISKLIELINQLAHINDLKSIIFSDHYQSQVQGAIVRICNIMLTHEYLAIFNCRLLYTVAFSKEFSRSLWKGVIQTSTASLHGVNSPIYSLISHGSQSIRYDSWKAILPKLRLFCSLCSYLLPTLGDDEFYTNENNSLYKEDLQNRDNSRGGLEETAKDHHLVSSREVNNSTKSFYIDKELVGISAILRDICVGMIQIIYQGKTAPQEQRHVPFGAAPDLNDAQSKLLSYEIKTCFQAVVRLVCQLHARDSRKQFCPERHWICPSVIIPANKAVDFQLVTSQQGRLLNQMTREDQSVDRCVGGVSSEIKTVLILQEIPFVISFHDRVQIFQQLLRKEHSVHHSEGYHFGMPGSAISVQVRRNYIYEDAFEKLSFDNESNMKLPLRVSLINAMGAHEAGIDGGGLTKEFLDELLKAGFDPMRGFFKYTKDHFLYPNPSANVLFSSLSEGFEVHYEFLGRMLGKAIFEKLMVELPLASFFLAKLLAAKHSSDVDLHNLESLDPVLYKNLVYLKNYKGDVADLNLDFTISNNELDEHEVVELKPSGSKIPVTRENKIEYVHLVADYRLNKQIRAQCAAFKRGLAQLVDLDWLRMFDPRELQILVSGAPTEIDVEDWRRHTNYGSGYSESNDVIKTFWNVVKDFDEPQKRKLLKFATSCSLPPLLGFKDLVPQFAIAPSEKERLPTASTCMNLLKLPSCEDEETMRSKLLYAIESNSGFELS